MNPQAPTANVPSQFGATQTMTGKGPTLADQTLHVFEPKLEDTQPMGKMTIDGVHWGYWTPEQVGKMVLQDRNNTFVLDVRSSEQAETSTGKSKRHFLKAHRMYPSKTMAHTPQTITAAVAELKKNSAVWAKLLAAKYVVVHCQEGLDRSPRTMEALYAELGAGAGKTIAGRNPQQRIGLLLGGFDAAIKELSGEPNTFEAATEPFTNAEFQAALQYVQAGMAALGPKK